MCELYCLQLVGIGSLHAFTESPSEQFPNHVLWSKNTATFSVKFHPIASQ